MFRGFEERLHRELRSVVEAGLDINVRKAADPVLDAWKGAAGWWSKVTSSERKATMVTRAEYLEKGSEYIKVGCSAAWSVAISSS